VSLFHEAALEHRALRWLTIGLTAAAAVVVWPYAPWILLALWAANLARPLHTRLARLVRGHNGIAATITIMLLIAAVVPVIVVLAALASDGVALIQRLIATDQARELLRRLVASDDLKPRPASDLTGLLMSQGEHAWTLAQRIAGTTARIVMGLVIFIAGTYTVLVDGAGWYAWTERHVPIPAPAFRRLTDAFIETGRGLLVGSVGAALTQAIVATIIYVALGVPRPLVLGCLTLLLAFIPAIGTALVWLPVAAGLFVTGRPAAAILLVVLGLGVIGTIDNLVRPYLARRGHLQLPTYVVLVAMFGGLLVLGPWGLVIAPLTVRLAKEALAIAASDSAHAT
jgi:predicted PurR-regulated permease PerM